MRVLGIDPGARRIGLALSDPEGQFASPLPAVVAHGADEIVRKLAAEVARCQAVRVVMGLPLRLDGSEGESARLARRLAERLQAETGLPVVLWDERLTSRAAQRTLNETGTRRSRRKQAVDSIAAALLLQSYLDAERERDGRGG
jgi:putative Holliday junction resolvase